jgi:hypothetical protein
MEMKIESETIQGHRSHPSVEVDLGPSVLWRITRDLHLDAVTLFGVTGSSPRVETWIVLGFDFGPGHKFEGHAPVSLQSR